LLDLQCGECIQISIRISHFFSITPLCSAFELLGNFIYIFFRTKEMRIRVYLKAFFCWLVLQSLNLFYWFILFEYAILIRYIYWVNEI
jgi:hypothetical protein